jgi:hypothetical protein
MVHAFPCEADLWRVQNSYYHILQTAYAQMHEQAEQGDNEAHVWIERFIALGHNLAVRVR